MHLFSRHGLATKNEQALAQSNLASSLYGLSALLLALFLSLSNQADGTDGVDYATSIKQGVGLFHPHHVLYGAFGFVVHRALAFITYIDPLILMTVLSSLVTTISLIVFFMLVKHLTESTNIALLITAFYAFNYSTIYMGTAAEVYPYAALCELLALLVLLRAPRPSWPVLSLVAALGALAVLFHQTAVFFVMALVLFIGLKTRSFWAAAGVAVSSGALTIGVYIFAAWKNNVHNLSEFLRWIFSYVHTSQYAEGSWGSGLSLARIPAILFGIVSTLISPNYQKYIINGSLFVDWTDFVFFPAVAVVLIALALTIRWLFRKRRSARSLSTSELRPLLQLLLFWILLGGLFVAWWDQGNIEFWYMLVAPVLLLLALGLRAIEQAGTPLPRCLAVVAFGLLVANLAGRVHADSRPANSLVRGVLAGIGCERLADGDLLVGPIWDLPPMIRYKCGRETATASIHLAPSAAAQREQALQRYSSLLFAGRKHVYWLETELVATIRNSYFSSDWENSDVEAFYLPLLKDAPVIGSFRLAGRTYKIHELHRRAQP